MKHLEVSGAVRHTYIYIYMSLGGSRLTKPHIQPQAGKYRRTRSRHNLYIINKSKYMLQMEDRQHSKITSTQFIWTLATAWCSLAHWTTWNTPCSQKNTSILMSVTQHNRMSQLKISGMIIIRGKAIPLQPWTGPEGSRRLRLRDFKTIGTWRW